MTSIKIVIFQIFKIDLILHFSEKSLAHVTTYLKATGPVFRHYSVNKSIFTESLIEVKDSELTYVNVVLIFHQCKYLLSANLFTFIHKNIGKKMI